MPWIDPARLGPVSLKPYLWTFAVLVIPNLLFTGALLALLAVTTRSILWVYIGVLGFFVLYGVSAALLTDLDNVWLATLVEPLGMRALSRTHALLVGGGAQHRPAGDRRLHAGQPRVVAGASRWRCSRRRSRCSRPSAAAPASACSGARPRLRSDATGIAQRRPHVVDAARHAGIRRGHRMAQFLRQLRFDTRRRVPQRAVPGDARVRHGQLRRRRR